MITDPVHVDKISGQTTTGHEWDGIRELNTPLPRWWLWLFYLCIAFSVGYWFVYPSWPLVSSYLPGLFGTTNGTWWRRTSRLGQAARMQLAAGLEKAGLQQDRGRNCRRSRSLRARRRSATSTAKAPSVASRTRAARAAKSGSPARLVRSTRVLTKKPMSPSISDAVRPAIGEPTTTSSSPVRRARRAAKAARSDMKRVAPRAWPRASETPGERRRQGERRLRAAEGLHRRARPVGRQGEDRRGAGEAPAPEVELRLEHRAGEPAALPDGEVGVLDGERREAATAGRPPASAG